MNLKSLRAFLFVMDEGSLIAASQKMNLSQPAVSRLIQLLEEEFKVQLFYRDRKSLQPTPEAERFYSEAFRVVSAVNEFPNVFAQLKTNADYPLRIICHPRMVNGLVVPAINRLLEKTPDIQIKLDVHPRRELGRRIVNDGFDVGVFTVPIHVDQVELVSMHRTKLCAFVSKQHPLASQDVVRADDLRQFPYIALNRELIIRQSIDRLLMQHGDHLNVSHEVSSASAAHRMALSGMGFTLTDTLAMEVELLDQGRLIPLSPVAEIDAGFYVPQNATKDERAVAYLEALREICEEKI
ncbi:LysR family transcriptional regulator [Cognatishimia sp. 1_MG-2023]|uniref:LysR family transcriptional regulator n=1 Tax=Cognatishimia sp. 1_MG-2023 TaxID=3062642 RepID=UPI0026E25EC9|nr:LysR family transcriptional regulator [Cognatishimia sp. 1_MG-2023]MDO6728253.1 LysR family transcriptional regulator [Cognatishimia sp. 1_MG-2023]